MRPWRVLSSSFPPDPLLILASFGSVPHLALALFGPHLALVWLSPHFPLTLSLFGSCPVYLSLCLYLALAPFVPHLALVWFLLRLSPTLPLSDSCPIYPSPCPFLALAPFAPHVALVWHLPHLSLTLPLSGSCFMCPSPCPRLAPASYGPCLQRGIGIGVVSLVVRPTVVLRSHRFPISDLVFNEANKACDWPKYVQPPCGTQTANTGP